MALPTLCFLFGFFVDHIDSYELWNKETSDTEVVVQVYNDFKQPRCTILTIDPFCDAIKITDRQDRKRNFGVFFTDSLLQRVNIFHIPIIGQ